MTSPPMRFLSLAVLDGSPLGAVALLVSARIRARTAGGIPASRTAHNRDGCNMGAVTQIKIWTAPHLIRNCDLATPAWQWVMAQAMASAASSGFGISSSFISSLTICWICFLSARPLPVIACLICMGVYS